jgi:hypothetical protein
MHLEIAEALIRAPDNDLGPALSRWVNASQDGLVSWYKRAYYRFGKAVKTTTARPCFPQACTVRMISVVNRINRDVITTSWFCTSCTRPRFVNSNNEGLHTSRPIARRRSCIRCLERSILRKGKEPIVRLHLGQQ